MFGGSHWFWICETNAGSLVSQFCKSLYRSFCFGWLGLCHGSRANHQKLQSGICTVGSHDRPADHNTIRVPDWLRPAVLTELYIKTGLVILGAEVLWHRLVALGVPGIAVAWVVTPVVLITTYWFGTKVLRLPSKSLAMVISADMSVCGVSAAIATAASCRAKKEELSFAIAISLMFTVVMMVVMPIAIGAIGLDEVVGALGLVGPLIRQEQSSLQDQVWVKWRSKRLLR